MELQTRIELYGFAITALGFMYAMFRGFKKDIERRFDTIDQRFNRVDSEMSSLREDVSEIKERMAFLEAANIYTMPAEASQPNTRSMAAIKMHQRRRQKKLERKGP